jgi:hypothetical protein
MFCQVFSLGIHSTIELCYTTRYLQMKTMMKRVNRISASRISLVALIVMLIFQQAILGEKPDEAHAAVTLLYFRGQHEGDSVLLQWATATELDTAYFYLERSAEEAGPYQTLGQIGIVPAEAPPDGLTGAQYERRDDDSLVTNRAYWYVLVEVEIGLGNENRTQPISVAAGDSQPTRTATPTATDTFAPTPSPTPSQSAANVTPTPTVLASGSLATASAGATLLPGITRTPSAFTQASGDDPQTLALANAAVTAGASDIVGSLRTQAQVTPAASAYPGPDEEVPAGSSDTESTAYPAAPPTPKVFATSGYPALPRPNNVVNGTSIPGIRSRNESQDNQIADDTMITNTSPLLGTLFLWLGFAAALVVFVSAVVGAAYFYSRQRTGSN